MVMGLSLCAVSRDPKQLHDVFQVHSSCLQNQPRNRIRPVPEFDGKPIYDPEKAYEDRHGNALNNIWWQVNQMMFIADSGLEPEVYEEHDEIKKLAFSFWGVDPNEVGHIQKLDKVRGKNHDNTTCENVY